MTQDSPSLLNRAAQIRMLAMDVDGVLTPSDITYLSNGEEIKTYNVKDGHGIWMLGKSGIVTAIITGRQSPINERRAQELEINALFQGVKRKFPVLQQLADEHQIALHEIAYIGDDLPDLDILTQVGLAACPKDAVSEVQAVCHFTTSKDGGRGAVRELADLILRAKGLATIPSTEGLKTHSH